uniref:Putative secreted protein n=1 Tax=Anopheles darlingi TaxID=43151 RepID=A0A2M4D4H7_ANODA
MYVLVLVCGLSVARVDYFFTLGRADNLIMNLQIEKKYRISNTLHVELLSQLVRNVTCGIGKEKKSRDTAWSAFRKNGLACILCWTIWATRRQAVAVRNVTTLSLAARFNFASLNPSRQKLPSFMVSFGSGAHA